MKLRNRTSKSLCGELRVEDNVMCVEWPWGVGRDEGTGLSAQAKLLSWFSGTAAVVCSALNKVHATSNLNPSIPISFSAYRNAYTCLTSFISFARCVVSISLRRCCSWYTTSRPLPAQRLSPIQGLAAHTLTIRAANKIQKTPVKFQPSSPGSLGRLSIFRAQLTTVLGRLDSS